VIVHSPGALKQLLAQSLSAEGCVTFRILYQPLSGNLEEHFESVTFLALAFGQHGPGLIYAVDEIDRFCSASFVPPSMKELINYGRHRKISMICTSRRPAQVARELTSQCSEIRCFRTTEPRDIRYFEDIMGQAAQQLPSLEQYTYLRWTDDGKTEIRGGKI
jgi:hypothetical protein